MERWCGLSLRVWFMLVVALALLLGYALGELAGVALIGEELQQLRAQKASAQRPQWYRICDENGQVHEVEIGSHGGATMRVLEGEQAGSLAGLPAKRMDAAGGSR